MVLTKDGKDLAKVEAIDVFLFESSKTRSSGEPVIYFNDW